MKKYLLSFVSSVCALLFASSAFAAPADPVVLWKNFNGLTAENPLAADRSSTQGGLTGEDWLFNLGAGSVTDGVLQTGTGISPAISLGEQLAFGYNSGEKHATVIIAVQAPVALIQNKPFIHLTNNSTGVGVAMYNATTLRGSWGTNYWGNEANNKTAVTIDDLTTATDVVYIALATNTGNSGNNITRIAIVDPDTSTVTWTSISGLYGSGINVTDIRFGNYTSTATGGLDYKLLSAAVYEGRATDETLLSFVTARTANDMAFTTSGACTRVASGATLTLSDGVTLDLGGATFGEEKATIALAEGATSATVHIYTADKVKLNDLPEGVTLVETRPSATLTWDNTQTTWSADTQWVFGDTTTKFQEGDTIVFDLTEDKEITFNGSFKPEAIVVKGAKLTIKAPGHTTTVHTLTTLADGGSLDVSDTGGSTYLAAVDVGEGCTLFANLDQMPGGISGSGKWCYNTSDSVTYASGMANLTIWVKKGNTFQAQQNANASLPASLSLELEGGARFYFPAGGTIASPIKVLSSATPENPAQLDGSYYGGTTPLTGAITLDGTLKLITGTTNCGNAYNISGAITGPGGLIVDDSQSQLVELTGVNTFTGGLTVNRNVTIDHDAVGRGDITVTAETLTVTNGSTLTILSGKTLAGAGTIAGNVEFADGAILDASQVLSVTGVSSAGTAKIKLAEAPADGTTAVKVLSATSVELPFAATIVYGEDETELTGWVTTSESDGLYIIKADTIKETTLTPPAEGELTWAGAWGENAPGESESATLIVTQDITLDIGTTELPVGAVTIKKGETATTTPTLTLTNMANFAPSGILLEGVNLAFAGTTEADATTMITYPIMGAGAVTVTEGAVSLTNAGNTFDGGVTIASGATVATTVANHSVFGTGTVTVAGTLNADMYGCFIGAGQVVVKQGGVLNGVNNVTWGARIHLEEGAVANFPTQYGLSTDSGQTAGVFTGAGTVNVTYSATSNYANPADATFKNSTEWTGTVKFASSDLRNLTFAQYGNANSTLEFAGLTGWNNGGDVTVKKVIISGDGWRVNDGGSSATTKFNAPFEGTAPMTFEGSSSQVYQFLGDMSGYTGNIKVVSNFGVTFGDVALDNNANDYGVIVIKEGVTTAIAPSVTWEAGNATTGLRLNGTLNVTTGTGLSTIKGVITGTGTVKIGEGRSLKVTGTVASTVKFTTEVAGKIVAKTTDDTGTTYSLAEPKADVVSEDELRTALANDNITTITATGSFDIAGELTLAEGKTFVIPEGVTVTATATATVYIQGVISVKGTLDGSAIPYGNPGLVPSQDGYVEIGANGHVIMPNEWASAGLNPTNMSVVGTCEEGATITFVDAAVWNYTNSAWVKEAPAIVPPKPDTTDQGTVNIEIPSDAENPVQAAQDIIDEMNKVGVDPIMVDANTTVALKVELAGAGTEADPYRAQLAFADETAAAAVLTPEVGVAEDSTAEPIAITADGVQLTIAKSVEGLWYGYKTGATLAEVMAAEINTDVAFTKGNGQELTLPKVTDAQFFKVVVLPYNPNK